MLTKNFFSYRMPAEWEPHGATWLAWPVNASTWPGGLLSKVESVYLQMISALLPGEKVNLLVRDETAKKKILRLLPRTSKIQNLFFHKIRYADSWIRDWGPIFIKAEGRRQKAEGKGVNDPSAFRLPPSANSGVILTKWRFNAWGGKYKELVRDNLTVDKIKALKQTPRLEGPMVLEGGSIDVNGQGTLLTTEQCLLNPNRNPGLSRKAIEGNLKFFLGIKKVIWLKNGIEGDDTDGHIDDVARFVSPGAVVAVEALEENLKILRQSQDQDGKKIKVVELPDPDPVKKRGATLPASYANFYIANRVVLLPVFKCSNDKKAAAILKRFFPDRKIISVDCTGLVSGLGAIHCVTQQEPL